MWVRGPGHPTLHHRCVFPNTGNALPELVRTGLLINSTVDTLGNNAGTVPVTAATALATLPPVLLALFAANAMGSRVPVWASKVRGRGGLGGNVCVCGGGGWLVVCSRPCRCAPMPRVAHWFPCSALLLSHAHRWGREG